MKMTMPHTLTGRRIIASLVLVAFLLTSGMPPARQACAQDLFPLATPGTRVSLSPAFEPGLLQGVKAYPDNPFRLDFILDQGNSTDEREELKATSSRLIKYFLAALTVPEKDLWVNLSPYEKDRIIPNAFGVTEMGRDLLAQDYLLKQITASVIYPEGEIGKKFWAEVYRQAWEKFGTTAIPVDTFNKVWITPDKAVVYENKDSAYVVESRLKVMLESDYLAQSVIPSPKGEGSQNSAIPRHFVPRDDVVITKQVLREIIIPLLEKEVNEGRNFAMLRQVYHSLILATWFKNKIRESVWGQAYVDQDKIAGIDIEDKAAKDKIWAQYVEAFKKGVYNYIKEEVDPATQEVVPRKYFSGGFSAFGLMDHAMSRTQDASMLPQKADAVVSVNFIPRLGDPSMSVSGEGIDRIMREFNRLYQASPQSRGVALLQDALGDTNKDLKGSAIGQLADKARTQRRLGRLEAAKATLLFAREQMNKEGTGWYYGKYEIWLDIISAQAEVDVHEARKTFLLAEECWRRGINSDGDRFYKPELAAQRMDLAFQLGLESAQDMVRQAKNRFPSAGLGPIAAMEFKYHLNTAQETFSKAKDALWAKAVTRGDLEEIARIAEIAVANHVPLADSIVREAKRLILEQGTRNNYYREVESRIAYLEFVLGHSASETDTFLESPRNTGFNSSSAFYLGLALAKMGRYDEAVEWAFAIEPQGDLLQEIAVIQAKNGLREEALKTAALINVQGDGKAGNVYGDTLIKILSIELEQREKDALPVPLKKISDLFLYPQEETPDGVARIELAREEISTDAPEYNRGTALVTWGPSLAVQLRRAGIEAVISSEVLEKDIGVNDGTDHWQSDLVGVYLMVPEQHRITAMGFILGPKFVAMKEFLVSRGLSIDPEMLMQIYSRNSERREKIKRSGLGFGVVSGQEAKLIRLAERSTEKLYNNEANEYRAIFGGIRSSGTVMNDPLINDLRNKFNIDVYIREDAELDDHEYGNMHVGKLYREKFLVVPQDAEEFVALYLAAGEEDRKSLLPKGKEADDSRLSRLSDFISQKSMSFQPDLLRETYARYKSAIEEKSKNGFGHGSYSSDGVRVFPMGFAIEEHLDEEQTKQFYAHHGVSDMEVVVVKEDAEPWMDVLQKTFKIEGVYKRQESKVNENDSGSRHYAVLWKQQQLVVPEDVLDFFIFCWVIPKDLMLKIFFGEGKPFEDARFGPVSRLAQQLNPQVDLKAFYELYQGVKNRMKPVTPGEAGTSTIVLGSNYYKIDTWEEFNDVSNFSESGDPSDTTVDDMERTIEFRVEKDDLLLNTLKSDLGIPSAYKRVQRGCNVDYDVQRHLGSVRERVTLVVPSEYADLVSFYLAAGDAAFRKILFGFDDRFAGIERVARKINPRLDVKALHGLYEEFRPVLSEDATRMIGGPIYLPRLSQNKDLALFQLKFHQYKIETSADDPGDSERRVDSDPLLDILKHDLQVPGAYKIETVRGGPSQSTIDHYGWALETTELFVPKEYESFVSFYLAVGDERFRKMVFADAQPASVINESMMALSVRTLGKGQYNPQMGNKEAGFLIFQRLGLPYPPGIVLSEDLVNTLLELQEKGAQTHIAFIKKTLENAGIASDQTVSVRSNPKRSMPGILKTVTDVLNWFDGVRQVSQAWYTDKAKEYRRREGIGEAYNLPVIIQRWVSGYKEFGYEKRREKEPFLPLYASGVFSTRDPNTNEKVLFGRYLENAKGEDLMTGGKKGSDINALAQAVPDIYRQLVVASKRLEESVGPQEIEFVVNDGKLYFLQTRRINFAPQAEIDYLKKSLAEGKILEARAIPQIEKLQKKLGARKTYRVKDTARAKSLARAETSTPGAIRGHLVWNMEKARQWMSEGKPLIFVADKQNQDKILSMVFDYPQSGLITNYGNNSSHEAVLTRLAGIPSLINAKDVAWWSLTGGQGIAFSNGSRLQEGDLVVLDGDSNNLWAADGVVLEENGMVKDASYGIDIPAYRKIFLAPYVNGDGSIKPEYDVQRLEEINKAAHEKFLRINAVVEKLLKRKSSEKWMLKVRKSVFTANLEKHFLHDLLTQQQEAARPDHSMGNTKGGIDLGAAKRALRVQNSGNGIQFKFDPAMLQKLQNASGLTPLIIDIRPMTTSVPVFLRDR